MVPRPSDKTHRVTNGYALSSSALCEYNPDFTKKVGLACTLIYILCTAYTQEIEY